MNHFNIILQILLLIRLTQSFTINGQEGVSYIHDSNLPRSKDYITRLFFCTHGIHSSISAVRWHCDHYFQTLMNTWLDEPYRDDFNPVNMLYVDWSAESNINWYDVYTMTTVPRDIGYKIKDAIHNLTDYRDDNPSMIITHTYAHSAGNYMMAAISHYVQTGIAVAVDFPNVPVGDDVQYRSPSTVNAVWAVVCSILGTAPPMNIYTPVYVEGSPTQQHEECPNGFSNYINTLTGNLRVLCGNFFGYFWQTHEEFNFNEMVYNSLKSNIIPAKCFGDTCSGFVTGDEAPPCYRDIYKPHDNTTIKPTLNSL